MEKNYNFQILIFVGIITAGFLGFYNSYFSLFPTFEGLHFLIHLHTGAFLVWFILIIWQPILIKQKKFETHKKIGKLSFLLVAFIFISVIAVSALWIRQKLPLTSLSREEFFMQRFPGLFQGVLFTLYFLIAMKFKRNVRLHVAFVIAATLVVFTPSFGRFIELILPEEIGMPIVILIEFLLLIGIVMYEKVKSNRNIFRNPYLLIAGLLIIQTILFITFPQTILWQSIMEKFASLVI